MKSVKLRISCHTICLLALSILLATAKTVSAQSLEWVLVDDTDTYSVVNAIAVDEATGSLYAGGKIAGSSVNLSLDGVGVDAIDIFNFSGSSNDAFVARTTTDGAVIWMKVFGDVAKTEVMDVAVGIDGNVYVTGYFKHSFTLDAYGGGTIVINEVGGGDYDIFTIGFNQDGEALWGRVDGGTKDDSGLSIVATATKIAVLGYFENDETTLCDIIPTQNTGTTDYCVMTFDYAGNPLWFSTWGSSMDDFNTSSNYINQRPSLGNCGEELYAIGGVNGFNCAVFGSGNTAVPTFDMASIDAGADLFTMAWNADGSLKWTNLVLIEGSMAGGYALDSDCSMLYYAFTAQASLLNSVYFPGGTTIDSGDASDMILAGVNLDDGLESWVKLLSDPGTTNMSYSLAVDQQGTLVLGGTISSLTNWSPFSISNVLSSTQAFAATYGTDGTFVNAIDFGGTAVDKAFDVALTSSSLIVGGLSSQMFDLSLPAVIANNENAFAAKFTKQSATVVSNCLTPVAAGTASASNYAPAISEIVTLDVTGQVGNIQWQKSTDGETWLNINGAVAATYLHTVTEDIYMRTAAWLPSCGYDFSDKLFLDIIDVVLLCPNDVTVDADANCQYVLPDYTAFDLALGNYQDPPAGTLIGLGDTEVKLYSATDVLSCSFVVTVKDTSPPTATCPSNFEESANADCEFIIPDYTGLGTYSDNCGFTVSQDPAEGTIVPIGETTVTLTATDDAGQSASCTFIVDVVDTTDPDISCPGDQVLMSYADCEAILPDYTGLAVATDACNVPNIVQTPAPGTIVTGDLTITLDARDGNLNNRTCTFDVDFQVDGAPAISCPANQFLTPNASCAFVIPDYTALGSASDACESFTIIQSPAAGTVVNSNTLITFTATDNEGETASCTFNVSLVYPFFSPSITCPGDQVVAFDDNCAAKLDDYISSASVSGFCMATLVITQDPVAGSDLAGPTEVKLTATDALGNQDQCTFWVTPEDQTNPSISCPPNQFVTQNASCQYVVGNYKAMATVDDNCDVVVDVDQNPLPGTVITSTTTITLTATDDAGNSASCNFNLGLVGLLPVPVPSVTCPGDQTVAFQDASCSSILEDYTDDAVADDFCSASLVLTQNPPAGTEIFGPTTVTITASDLLLNLETCSFIVTPTDQTAPSTTCLGDKTVDLDANCEYVLDDFVVDIIGSDNCDADLSMVQTPAPGTVITSLTNVVITVTDDAGNSTTCTFSVTPEDNSDPVFACPADQVRSLNTDCEYVLESFEANASISDNCGYTYTQNPAAGTVLTADQLITISVYDDAGNGGTCSFMVMLEDNSAPSITCPANITLEIGTGCEIAVGNLTGLVGVADCSGYTISQSFATTHLLPVGTYSITFTVTDVGGEESSCDVPLYVLDTTSPIITCPADQNVNIGLDCQYVLIDYTASTVASDFCLSNISQNPAAGTALDPGTYTITLTATDFSNNTTSCDFDLVIVDNSVPSPSSPAAITRALDADCEYVLEDLTSLVTVDLTCPIWILQSPLAGTILSAGQTITFTVMDSWGNSAATTSALVLEDNILPTIDCPLADWTYQADANCEYILPDLSSLLTFSDNCGAAVFGQSVAVGTPLSPGTHAITVTVTDGAGNSVACDITLVVEDNLAPTMTCEDFTVQTNLGCQYELPVLTSLFPPSENCGAYTFDQAPAEGTLLDVGVHTINYTISDLNGNSLDCSLELTVESNAAPQINNCPGDQILAANDDCEAILPDYGSALIVTTCGGSDAVYTITQFPAAGTIINSTTAVLVIVTNSSGLSTACSFDVDVEDQEGPELTCANAPILAQLNANCLIVVPNVLGSSSATDNCTSSPTLTQSPTAGSLVDPSNTSVVITATDESGNTSTCTVTLAPVDQLAPTLSNTPPNLTVSANALCKFPMVNYMGLFLFNDNCDNSLTITQTPVLGASLALGVYTVTVTATDDSGNSTSGSFQLTVADSTPPTMTGCPGDQSISSNAQCQIAVPNYLNAISTTDNCSGGVTLNQSPAAGALVNSGQVVVITATDAAGNSSSCQFTLTFVDTLPPTISCGGSTLSAQVNASCSYTLPNYVPQITATDACGTVVSIVQSPAPGATMGPGIYTITFTATDNSGNQSSCSKTLTVSDLIAPLISACPGTTTVTVNSNCEAVLANYTTLISANDNCGTVTKTQSPVAGTILAQGTYQITLTATDAAGNSTSCNFTLNVVDATDPSFTSCPDEQILIASSNCSAVMPDFTGQFTATDNCADQSQMSVSQNPAAGTLVSGTFNAALTVADPSGNDITCFFQIEVIDATNPEILCSNDIEILVANDNCEQLLPDLTTMASATDNCGGSISISQVPAEGTWMPLGDHIITITATDDAANFSTCEVNVSVVDETPPFVDGDVENLSISLDSECNAIMPDLSGIFMAMDNCDDDVTFLQVPAAGTPLTMGDNPASIQLVDDYDNTFLDALIITVIDDTAPVLDCPGDQVVALENGCFFVLPNFVQNNLATDCSEVVFSQSPVAGTIISEDTVVQITATDEFNNSSSCEFTLSVQDVTPPEFSCPDNQIIQASSTCDMIMPDFLDGLAILESCELQSIIQSPEAGTAFLPGDEIEVSITAIDEAGNEAMCSFSVTFVDDVLPEINCPDDILIGNDPGECGATVLYAEPEASDNCEEISLVLIDGPISGSFFPLGTTQITYEVTDGSGLVTQCSFNVTVEDLEPPQIECPPSIETCVSFIEFDIPTATDNCGEVTVVQTDNTGLTSGMEFPVGTSTLTYQSTDEAGNTALCTVEITVGESITIEWNDWPTLICADQEPINFNTLVEGDLSLTWSDPIPDSGWLNPGELSPGVYEISVNATDGNCQGEDVQSFTLIAMPNVDAGDDLEVCGLEVQLEASSDAETHLWSGSPDAIFSGSNQDSSPIATVLEYGTYIFNYSGTTAGQCTSTDQIEVVFWEPVLLPEAGPDQVLDATFETFLSGEYFGPGDTNWGVISGNGQLNSPDQLSTDVVNLSLGSNEMILTASNGVCPSKSDTLVIVVNELVIPTGFSPNGDMVNDLFEIDGLENYPFSSLTIFNRWGNEVYQNADYKNDWDGTGKNGKVLPADTYFMVITIDHVNYESYLILRR